ncbi:uncharacterized protein LOC141651516 [Silene latifolia]|uniref:uncharacterized protein LOC141651516 n=1 Tax=Silene latifolia TaxID=37657 RepID=UPI003D7842E5
MGGKNTEKGTTQNIRGFNDPIKQQEVRGYLSRNKVEVFGLLETRVKQNNFATIIRTFPSYSVLNNYTHHYNGRIWVFLDNRRVTWISSSGHDQLIHLELLHHISNKTVHVSFVYGSNDATHRERLWHELRGLKPKVTNWILMGDWNIVRAMEERIGPNPPSITEILAFNQSLLDCQLEDLHSFGCEFTWTNKRDTTTIIWSRLDRVISNSLWMGHFPNTQVNVLPSGISDHSPLLVSIHDHYQQKRRFSYLNCWEDHKDYGKVVKEAWDIPVKSNAIHRLFPRLKNVRLQLINIHKTSYSGISGKVKEAQQYLHDYQISVQTKPLDSSLLALEQTLLQTYLDLKKAEKSSLTQRAKIQDIKYNYAPTSYYFARIAARKHQSIIGKIKDRHGIEREGMHVVNHAFIDYYQWLLGKEQGAFVTGRSIFENIMLTQSLIKGYGQQGVSPRCLINVDIKKAFDSLQWEFIGKMLQQFHFPEQFQRWIMGSCLVYMLIQIKQIYMGGIREGIKQEILRATSYIEGELPFRYLGVPLNEGKLNKAMFADLITKVQREYSGLLLSSPGDFWNYEESHRKLIMKSWDSCCTLYQEGGFNIKEILAWNKSIICKWIWEIVKHSDSSWTTWNYTYNIKYGDFWTLQKKSTHSESCRSILQVRDELLEMVGSGANMEALLHGCVKKGCIQLHLLYDQFRRKGSNIS